MLVAIDTPPVIIQPGKAWWEGGGGAAEWGARDVCVGVWVCVFWTQDRRWKTGSPLWHCRHSESTWRPPPKWMNGWMDGRMDRWTERQLAEWQLPWQTGNVWRCPFSQNGQTNEWWINQKEWRTGRQRKECQDGWTNNQMYGQMSQSIKFGQRDEK